MRLAFEFMATFCASIFAGAAVYVSVVEHPARIECGTRLALAEFGPSYRRGAMMQASLSIAAFAASVGAWLLSSRGPWLVGGVVIGVLVPFTLIVILPTNKKLLDSSLDPDSDHARQLLDRWGRLHWARTLLSLTATVIFLSNVMSCNDDIRRPREAVLRQDLLTMRSLISQYALDKQSPQESIDDLVRAGYLKQPPVDPMTGRTDTWKLNPEDIRVNPTLRPVLAGCTAVQTDALLTELHTTLGDC
jgi:competence protein ComGC